MLKFQSDAELIKRLNAAAGKRMSAEQLRAQRVSFVMSTADTDDFSRADVERAIDEREGTAA